MWRTIAQTNAFARRAGELLSAAALDALHEYLANNPLAGDLVPGLGGIRKLRWVADAKGQGARSGARVIYFVFAEDRPLYLLAIYGKGERADLTPDGKRAMLRLVAAIREGA